MALRRRIRVALTFGLGLNRCWTLTSIRLQGGIGSTTFDSIVALIVVES